MTDLPPSKRWLAIHIIWWVVAMTVGGVLAWTISERRYRRGAVVQEPEIRTPTPTPMLKPIGLWMTSFDDQEHPAPQELVREWQPEVQAAVVRYLRAGQPLGSYMGYSWCRFGCGIASNRMGSADLTDGTWMWPEGLAHYIEVHSVGLPEEFVAHVHSGATPSSVEEDHPVDWEYWTRWCAERRSPCIVQLRMEGWAFAQSLPLADRNARYGEIEREEGLSDSLCIWKNCQRRALKGKLVCAGDHIPGIREELKMAPLNDGFVAWVRGLPG